MNGLLSPGNEMQDPDLKNASAALERAAARARELARQTHTPLYVMRNGRVENIEVSARPSVGARLSKKV